MMGPPSSLLTYLFVTLMALASDRRLEKEEIGRREIILRLSLTHYLVAATTTPWASIAITPTTGDGPNVLVRVKDETPSFSTLVYERILGSGSFKTVYLVSSSSPGHSTTTTAANDNQSTTTYYALAVQRLRDKADVKDGLGGIRVAQELHRRLSSSTLEEQGQEYFEGILDWWFQSSPPLDYAPGMPVLSSLTSSSEERTQKPPHKFLGTKWLLAVKPLYDMDLRKFCQLAPTRYPIKSASTYDEPSSLQTVAGVLLTDDGALCLTRHVIHAGRLMHAVGLVHRDIKPKNIMLYRGRPVVIDFGFADFVDQPSSQKENGRRLCIEQPGRVKGEVDYVLAPDVAKFQGCQEGDAYALGKTLYEVLFAPAAANSPSGKQEITTAAAQLRNEQFRSLLDQRDSNLQSRFSLSESTADRLLAIIRGLCQTENPLSCAEAEQLLAE